MKKLTVFLIAVILTTSFAELQAQSKLKQSIFSISIQGGIFLPIGDLSDQYNIGGNVGLGLNFKVKSNMEIYAEGNHNFTGYKTSNGYNLVNPSAYNGKPSIFDAAIGVRFFFGQSKFKTFVEAGAGIYMIHTPSMTYTLQFFDPQTGDTIYNTFTDESRDGMNFGINAGLGEIFNVAKNVDLYLRSDFRSMIGGNDKGIATLNFFGVYAGAKFCF